MTPTEIEIAMFFAGIGLIGGLVLSDFLWRVKIRERGATGIRLLVLGHFYEVRDLGALNGGAGQ